MIRAITARRTGRLIAGLTAAACTLFVPAIASAAPQPSYARAYDTLANLGPDCAETATLVSTSTILGGATAYTEYLDGNQFIQVVPPPGWTPLNASADELDAYGFPPRPTDAAGLADWNDTWSQ